MKTEIGRIKKLNEERIYLLEVLELWAHAKNDISKEPHEIKAFTFRPEFLTDEQKRENGRKKIRYNDKNWHNAVRLHNGKLIKMSGIKRPVKPYEVCSVQH